MPSTRTFVALEIPEAQTEKLTRLQSLLASDIPGVRWPEAATFHLTLAFLGDVDDTDLNTVCRAVQRAASSSSALELRLEGIGAFPDPSRARTLWAGLGGRDLPKLLALQSVINQAVAEAGYPTGETTFHPHITLGRMQKGRQGVADVSPQLQRFRTWSGGTFAVSEVTTFASTLTREGPVYATLATAALPRRKSRPET